jgi:hypothetical protein
VMERLVNEILVGAIVGNVFNSNSTDEVGS